MQAGRPRHSQALVGRCLAAATSAERVAVPVQAFEIHESLRHAAVAGLVHSQHAVDAFHQATRAVSPAENVLHRRCRSQALVVGFAQHDRAYQQHATQGGRLSVLSLERFRSATQTFLTRRRLLHFLRERQSGNL